VYQCLICKENANVKNQSPYTVVSGLHLTSW